MCETVHEQIALIKSAKVARGMAAETSVESLTYFCCAVEFDPSHVFAYVMLGTEQVVAGPRFGNRVERSRDRADSASALGETALGLLAELLKREISEIRLVF